MEGHLQLDGIQADRDASGNYKIEEWIAGNQEYVANDAINMQITVEEVFDNHHKVVNHKARTQGKFTFTAAEAGDHKICFAPSRAAVGGAVVAGQVQGTMKMTLDLAIGETSKIERTDKGKMSDILSKVGDLKARLADIRREQVFQRVSRERFVSSKRCLSVCRNEKQSFEISLRLRIRESCDGPSCSLLFWVSRARGS